MANIGKQASILDFFKRKNEQSSSESKIKEITFLKTETNKKRTLDEDQDELETNSCSDLVVDVNVVDEQLLSVSFEEFEDVMISDQKENIDHNQHENEKTDKQIKTNYILEKFRQIVKNILSDDHYAYLFNEDDWKVIQEFTCLPGTIQLLFLRLYMRKRAWIRTSNIKYPEIDSNCLHKNDLENLVAHEFLNNSFKFTTIEEALNLMNLQELKTYFKNYNGFKMISGNKNQNIPRFISYIKSTRTVYSTGDDSSKSIENEVLKRLKTFFIKKCYKINNDKSKVFDRIFLLYYSPNYLLDNLDSQNDYQWHRNVFNDYLDGEANYPLLVTNKQNKLYISREEFVEFQDAFELVNRIQIHLNEKKYDLIVSEFLNQAKEGYIKCLEKYMAKDLDLDPYLRQFTATGMFLRAIHQCLTALEKVRQYSESIEIIKNYLLPQLHYGTKYRAHWCVRAALISHTHLKNLTSASEFCLFGLQDPFIKCGYRFELYTRLMKIDKKLKLEYLEDYSNLHYNEKTIFADYRNIENDTERKNFFFYTHPNGDEELLSVENVVIYHYNQNGYSRGIHCESSVYQMFLALLFWDIIYCIDFKDTFRYYKQLIPLDLKCDTFYTRRKDLIDNRIKQISSFDDNQLTMELINSWERNNNKVSLLANWNVISLEDLMEIAVCLSAKNIASICKLLIQDFRNLRRGFPDLIVWNATNKKIKLIEVKGPYDRLSSIQSIWLSHLCSFGLDAELCHVKPKNKNPI